MTTPRNAVTATIDAQNEWTSWMPVPAGAVVDISLTGVASSTVTLQRRFDGSTALDVDTFTAVAQVQYEAGAAQEMRIGVKTGAYGSDTIAAALYVG